MAAVNLVVHDTAEETYSASARRIAELIGGGGDWFTLGLAGGGTAGHTYRELRNLDAPWEKVKAWMSDERWVPPHHERSNGRMASEALMDHVNAEFHRPEWADDLKPTDSATHYEGLLREMHDGHRPDLILLGLGEDGHTASLFPGSVALTEPHRWFVANTIPETGEDRLTATYPLLWSARRLLLMTTGTEKAPAVRDSLEGKGTPAGMIGDGEAEVEWHVDRAAASLLS